METCYMCQRAACSREHVPPKNLFPESKDFDGRNFRINLITVPSCKLHNSAKSKDDEFLMVSLAGIFGNNSIGIRHRIGKVTRALHRVSNKLLDEVFTERRVIDRIDMKNNRFLEVIWGTPDHDRLIKCFDHVVRGLFFINLKRNLPETQKFIWDTLSKKKQDHAIFRVL